MADGSDADDIRRRRLGLILAQVRTVAVGRLILGIRLDNRPIWRQPAHDVPVGGPLVPELLSLPTQRPMQISQHQLMQLIPDHRLSRRLQDHRKSSLTRSPTSEHSAAATIHQNSVPSGGNSPPSSKAGAVPDGARPRRSSS